MQATPLVQIEQVLANPKLQDAIYSSTGRLMEKRRAAIPPELATEFQQWREQARRIKQHTLENLDYYLELLERKVTERGGQVVYARDAGQVAEFVLGLAKAHGAHLVVKSKSMTTEEIELGDRLEQAGIESVETDLGEYIVQLAHERPSHIVAPALHKTRYDIAELFHQRLGVEPDPEPEHQTQIARRTLRDKFLRADIGITGANFVIAETGSIAIIENEGNARMSSTLPPIHIAIAGIEKLIPRMADLAVFLKLLGRSATGQPLTVYTSILSGPRRQGEIDGPQQFYLVLLDNGRTRVLADRRKRQSLYCIRCGACLNHCPVYRKIGGHSYPWVYSGPIGAVITPQFQGLDQAGWLPFASSLCGACGEVCPVKIDLPQLLLDLRCEIIKAQVRERRDRLEQLAFRLWAAVMKRPKLYEFISVALGLVDTGETNGWLRRVPGLFALGPLKAWLAERDFPPPPPQTFRQWWRLRPPEKEELD